MPTPSISLTHTRLGQKQKAVCSLFGGFLLAFAPLGSYINPFGIALLCATDQCRATVLAGCLLALPFCKTGILLQALLLAGCFFLLALAEKQGFSLSPRDKLRDALSLSQAEHPASKGLRIVLCACCAMLTATGELLFYGFTPARALPVLALCGISPLFCFLFYRLLHEGFRDETALLGGCFAITQVFTPFSVGAVPLALGAGAICTLAMAKNKGFAIGCACGLLCGLTLGGPATGALGVLGITFGLLCADAELLSLLLGYMLAVSGLWYLGDTEAVPLAALVLGVGAIGFRVLSPQIPLKRSQILSPAEALENRRVREQHLQKYAAAFSSLSGVFYTVSETASPKTAEETVEGIRTVIGAFCANCEGCNLEPGELCNCFTDRMREEGVIHVPSLPTHILRNCPSIRPMAKTINNLPTIREKENEKGIRQMAAEYANLSTLLDAAARQEEAAGTKDRTASAAVKSALRDMKIKCDGVQVTGQRLRKVEVYGVDLPRIPVSPAALSAELSKVLGTRLSQPEFLLHDDYSVMRLVSSPCFRVEYAKCMASKAGEKICGDTVSFFETDDGYFYCLLSDGMGSGRDAALSSRLAAIMMEKLITVGAPPADALRMLNKALRQQEKEVFATVDLLQIDRFTGTATLIKAGAAPTLLLRGGNCRRFESKTPPAGIMKNVIAEKRSFKVQKGDVLLMISDGIMQTGDKTGALPAFTRGNAHTVASAVMTYAAGRTEASDDMSVCAVRLY